METPMLPAVRQQRIIELLARREFVTLTEVQAETGASMATTHRDLARLATKGALARVRGGATRPAGPPAEARLLAAYLVRVRNALERHDLGAVENGLHQALSACERLRSASRRSAPGGGLRPPTPPGTRARP
ncbi:DeoR family transcriptional regulator [Dactylosporangium salmoneum]|uniref:HTH deoR-type domain-containing protein n=1 Tax=Dactylosporangium salmoneum TaxID=53361 RepID=A0ABN3FNY8_9ACTN